MNIDSYHLLALGWLLFGFCSAQIGFKYHERLGMAPVEGMVVAGFFGTVYAVGLSVLAAKVFGF